MPDPRLEPARHEAELRKLRLEARLLEQQLSPEAQRTDRIKAYAGLGGVIAGFAAILSLSASLYLGMAERRETRQAKLEERIDKAMERAAGKDAGLQLSGIASLRFFLAGSRAETRIQILGALSKLLAVEDDAVVRSAMIDTFTSIPEGDDRALGSALQALAESSRALVTQGGLGANVPVERPAGTVEERAYGVGKAIEAVVRLGAPATDLAGIYCSECNFSGLDLAGFGFKDAILIRSDFSNANLPEVVFGGAELDGTVFVSADLPGASFVTDFDRRLGDYTYRRMQVFAAKQVATLGLPAPVDTGSQPEKPRFLMITGPDFSCANLSGARFDQYPLFRLRLTQLQASDHYPILRGEPANFRKANLTGTDFRKAIFYGAYEEDGEWPPLGWNREIPSGPLTFFSGYLADEIPPSPGGGRSILARNRVNYSFADTDWRKALLPAALRAHFERHPPRLMPSDMLPRGKVRACKPRQGRGQGS